MGGFNGSDNAPTVAQLQRMVAKGELKYVLLGGRGGEHRRVRPGCRPTDRRERLQASTR